MAVQVGEARAHSLPVGHTQQQQLHRDSSAGAPDSVMPTSLGHDAHDALLHSSQMTSSEQQGSGLKGGWQRGQSEQLHPLQQVSPRSAADGFMAGAAGERAAGSRPAKAGVLLDPGGGVDDQAHHVVMSSGALLHHLGAASHRSSAE